MRLREIGLLAALVTTLACDGHGPSAPLLTGPSMGWPDDTLRFEVRSTSFGGDSVCYQVFWEDGSDTAWSEWVTDGSGLDLPHVFRDTGLFGVTARAQDRHGLSAVSESLFVSIRNYGPNPPHRPSGPDTVAVDDTTGFFTLASHPLLKHVSIQFDWGDTMSGWGPFVSSEELYLLHRAYPHAGSYAIRARARDSMDNVSDWSPAKSVLVRDTFTLSGRKVKSPN